MQGILHITSGTLRGSIGDLPEPVIANIFNPDTYEQKVGTGDYWFVYPQGSPILVCRRVINVIFRLPTVSGKKYRFYTGCDYPDSAVYSMVSLNGYLSGTAAPLDLAGNPFPNSGDFQPIPGENNPVDFIARGETTLVFRCLNQYAVVEYYDPQVMIINDYVKKLTGALQRAAL